MPLVAGVQLLTLRALLPALLSVAQLQATLFVGMVSLLFLPPSLGLIMLFLTMICLLQNATVHRKKPPREKESTI